MADEANKVKKTKRTKRTQRVKKGILLLLILGIAGIGILTVTGHDKVDTMDYYGLAAGESAVFIDGIWQEDNGIVRDGITYLAAETINEELGGRFYYSDEGVVLYALPDEVMEIHPGTASYTIGETVVSTGYTICFLEGDILYTAVDFLYELLPVSAYTYTAPNRIHLISEDTEITRASVAKKTKLLAQDDEDSEYFVSVKTGTPVVVLEEGEQWTYVIAEGFYGYLDRDRLGEKKTVTLKTEGTEIIYSNLSSDHDILLVWHQVFNQTANQSLESNLSRTSGVNTISPTWFSLSDNHGNVTSIASRSYVEKAHEMGIQVWPLIDDFDTSVDLVTLLSSTASRENLVRNLVATALEYNFDGLNIDFERVQPASAEHFLQFLRELSIECRANNLVLSVDNYVPSKHKSHYNLKEQGVIVDYVVIMGYDEHYSGSDSAGSTSSLTFTRNSLINTTALVPNEKVIHGMPFYTRLWEETEEGLSSAAKGMSSAKSILNQNGADITWLEDAGQYYGEYRSGGKLYRMWLEDVTSLEMKMELAASYEPAGFAFWKLGLESSDVWSVIPRYLDL